MCSPLQSDDSINMLEMRAILSSIKYRARVPKIVGARFIHLVDSQVCLGAHHRYRSSNPRMNQVIAKISAHALATGSKPIFGYIPTDENPADAPSRFQPDQGKWEKDPKDHDGLREDSHRPKDRFGY